MILVTNPAVGGHYLPQGTHTFPAMWRHKPYTSTLPDYTAWLQMHVGVIGVNNLPNITTRARLGVVTVKS